jgi:hypothetical protein
LNLWETEGGCTFGGSMRCEKCAVPYLLWKFISGDILHGEMKRLSLDDWKNKLDELEIIKK